MAQHLSDVWLPLGCQKIVDTFSLSGNACHVLTVFYSNLNYKATILYYFAIDFIVSLALNISCYNLKLYVYYLAITKNYLWRT